MSEVKATAAADVLATAAALERSAGGVLGDELHFFAYLACLLSIYDGHSPEAWGYDFTATPAGAPFAVELAAAMFQLRAAGLVVQREHLFVLSASGRMRHQAAERVSVTAPRQRFVRAAANAAVLMPLPSVRDAMTHEPHLRQAMHTIGARELLDPAGLELVQGQFDVLQEALADGSSTRGSLVVPAVVWLTYLAESRTAEAE